MKTVMHASMHLDIVGVSAYHSNCSIEQPSGTGPHTVAYGCLLQGDSLSSTPTVAGCHRSPAAPKQFQLEPGSQDIPATRVFQGPSLIQRVPVMCGRSQEVPRPHSLQWVMKLRFRVPDGASAPASGL